jgi:hypothetical protein
VRNTVFFATAGLLCLVLASCMSSSPSGAATPKAGDQRSAVVQYLKDYNTVALSLHEATGNVDEMDMPGDRSEFPDFGAAMGRLIAAIDTAAAGYGGLRTAPGEPQTEAHKVATVNALAKLRASAVGVQEAIDLGDPGVVAQQAMLLFTAARDLRALNTTIETLLSRYSIQDAEVGYRFRAAGQGTR